MRSAANLLFVGLCVGQVGDQVVAWLSDEGVHDATGEGTAFVEVSAPREAYFVQEPIRLRLRFGIEKGFLETNLVQLFQQSLDVPVQMQGSFLQELPGAIVLEERASKRDTFDLGSRSRFALGESVAQATRVEDRVIDGREFQVLEIDRSCLPVSAGELVIPGPVLRFASATRFQEDVFARRVAADREDALVRGSPIALAIRPLPEKGRPPEFTGAVGLFSVQADADTRDLHVGESLVVSLTITAKGEGESNLGFFDAPRFPAGDGFHVRGVVEDKNRERHIVAYDLAPQSERVREIPPIAFVYFEPGGDAGYRTIRTPPIPLEVRPPPPSEGGGKPRPAIPWGAVLALLVLVAGLLTWWGMRKSGPRRDGPRDTERAARSG